MLYTGDAIVFAESAEELQLALQTVYHYCRKCQGYVYIKWEFCNTWTITVNTDKTKVVIFQKAMWPLTLPSFKSILLSWIHFIIGFYVNFVATIIIRQSPIKGFIHWLVRKCNAHCVERKKSGTLCIIYLFVPIVTHWGRVTHICVGNLTIIGSDNGLSPGRRQAIIWTNAGILLIRPLGTNFSEIIIGIQTFSFTKMHLKMSSAKWRPFCLGLNVLNMKWINLLTKSFWVNMEFKVFKIQWDPVP